MSDDRITLLDEDISEETEDIKEKTPEKEETKPEDNDYILPRNYINPFSKSKFPLVFSDVDFELNQNPRLFDWVKNKEIVKQIEQAIHDPNNNSKSGVERVWQYTRWKTWKYIMEQEKLRVVIDLEDNEKKGEARGTVSINGVTWYILKGEYVSAPKDIALMIETSQGQTSEAGKTSLLSYLSQKIDDKTGLPKDPSRLER